MEMSRASYETWVQPAELVRYENDLFTVGVPNAYACDWLKSRLTAKLNSILSGIMECPQKVEFIVWHKDYENQPQTASTGEPLPLISPAVTGSQPVVNHRYNFDNFVVGSSNRLAHAACLAVAENPAQAYNPLFLYGGVGLGKTHLLHAIGNFAQARGEQVLYVSSEEFTNDLINAIRTHTTQAFRDRYRRIDVLLVDDIQFIAGKESTQEEFFHTFNTLHGQDKQIVISSDRPPKAMNTLEERLRSRFEWGLTVDMQAPDYETRLAILQSKAEKEGRVVQTEIMELIAKTIQSNIRELEGAWNRVLAFSDLTGKQLTLQMAQNALADYAPQPSSLTPDVVVDVVADYFGIDPEKLSGRSRAREVALPRQVAMYLLREDSGISLPRIGKELGGRDHTTVMYACDKVAELIDTDDMMRRKVSQIRERLHNNKVLV